MPGLKLYTSNRLEILIEKLAEKISAKPLPSPLDKETIVVQSKGMERWISMELASRHGICANYDFPFPNAFAHRVFAEFIEDLPDESPFAPSFMTWKIMKHLPTLLNTPGFDSLKSYLENDPETLKLFQLSQRIAETFDQYLIFRPEMILGWKKATADHWQSILWQRIVGDQEITHRAAQRELFLKKVKDKSHKLSNLPDRISVFGISALPPFHIRIFAELSSRIEMNLFLMNPCREYWADIVSGWETDKITGKRKAPFLNDLHLEKGNSLLASLGAMGKDFFSLINGLNFEEYECFVDPGHQNMLSAIQSDILNLQQAEDQPDSTRAINANDYSIQVHSCHSPMREIEILYDNLLAMFEADPELAPRDILVMTPDIESYAPYIQAVFDTPSNDAKKIPFSIADRSFGKESPVIDIFMAILELCGSRFGASKVLAILESPYVYQKFGLAMEDVDLIQHWVKETRIRWGIDRHNRSQIGFPSYAENTWQAGLDRLLLGYAMIGENEGLFENILPYDEIEGEKALTLGKFSEFTEQLFSYLNSLNHPRTLSDWSKVLTLLCDKFILAADDTQYEIKLIRNVLNNLIEFEEIPDFNDKIGLDVIKSHLKHEFEKESSGFGFIAGAVTFCAMLPMRSIPFKIICLIGLNNDAFPRQSRPLSFDLIAKNPRAGDRSRRNDDRYLFLEALLSSRKRLYISYIGQRIADNSIIPPSVVVSELLDYIEKGFKIPEGNILDHVVTKHRLQAFSPGYFFGNKKLFSYSEENCQASQIMINDRHEPVLFIADGLPEADDSYRAIEIEQLCSFFSNPSKYLLKHRLGITLDQDTPTLENREPYTVSNLEKYKLENDLLKKRLEHEDIQKLFFAIKAKGILPHGAPGQCLYNDMAEDVRDFIEKIETYLQKSALNPLAVDLPISDFRLTGQIDNIYPDGLIQYRAAKVKAKDRLRVWLYHLMFNTLKPDGYPDNSIYVGSDKAFSYKNADDSAAILKLLLEIYWNGLHKPLPFFPETSLRFIELILKGKSENFALSNVNKIWQTSEHTRGESKDPCFELCFGSSYNLSKDFIIISNIIFEPLLGHQEEIEL